MLPEDFRYRSIESALLAISEGQDSIEWAEDQVDVYNAALADWLGSHGYRGDYVEDARREFGEAQSIWCALQQGQMMELSEIYGLCLSALEDLTGETADV